MLLHNQWITEEIKEEIKKYLETNENERNPNWKRRSKTVTVCRWHDTIHRILKMPAENY